MTAKLEELDALVKRMENLSARVSWSAADDLRAVVALLRAQAEEIARMRGGLGPLADLKPEYFRNSAFENSIHGACGYVRETARLLLGSPPDA